MCKNRKGSKLPKIRHKEEIIVINVVDLLDAIRNGLGLHGIVVITSEIVKPTNELMSKLEKKVMLLESNGTISMMFRPMLPPHPEKEASKSDDGKDDDKEDIASSTVVNEVRTTTLPTQNKVAILLNHGSFNPVHAHHVEMMQAAKVKLEDSGYLVKKGLMAITPRDIVAHKDAK